MNRSRAVLDHTIDYGEGDFRLRDSAGTIIVDATKDVNLAGRRVTPSIACPAVQWPASRLVFDAATGDFVVDRGLCLSANRRDEP